MRKRFNQSDWSIALQNWDKYTSPFRPSFGDIKNYSDTLKQYKTKKNILLLGSTPEIREVLSKLNSSVTIADFSFEMILGMLSFGKKIVQDQENWIKINWMDLNKFLKSNCFDLIIGDLVLRNIESNFQSKFLNDISKLLKPKGKIITRIHFFNEDLIDIDSNKIIMDVFKKVKNIDNKLVEDLIASRLLDKNTGFKNKKNNKELFAKNINYFLKNKANSKRERLILSDIIEKWVGPRIWTQRTQKEIEKLLISDFVIKDKKISKDYIDSEFYPMYILKKK